MKLFRVYNGYTGFSQVYVLVIAESEERALEIATETFKKEAEDKEYLEMWGKFQYTERYYTNLEIELLCDATQEWVSQISD
jgi:hypothetical protein